MPVENPDFAGGSDAHLAHGHKLWFWATPKMFSRQKLEHAVSLN
jgi:hypothetical protein